MVVVVVNDAHAAHGLVGGDDAEGSVSYYCYLPFSRSRQHDITVRNGSADFRDLYSSALCHRGQRTAF